MRLAKVAGLAQTPPALDPVWVFGENSSPWITSFATLIVWRSIAVCASTLNKPGASATLLTRRNIRPQRGYVEEPRPVDGAQTITSPLSVFTCNSS